MIKKILINTMALIPLVVSNPSWAADMAPDAVVESSAVMSAEAAEGLRKDLSYFFGFSFGNMLKEGGNVDVDLTTLSQGMSDSLEDRARI
jgi:hypothetical protein